MWGTIGLSLALAAGISVAGAGLYLEGKKAGKNQVLAEVGTQTDIARQAAQGAAQIAADAISKIKVQNRTVYSEVQREVFEKPVYRDCLHSPEQLRRINSALTGLEPGSVDSGIVPGAGSPVGPELRRDDAETDRGRGTIPGVPASGAR